MSKPLKIIIPILAGLFIIGAVKFSYIYYKDNMGRKVAEIPVRPVVVTEEEKALNEIDKDVKTADDLDTTELDELSKVLDSLDVSGIQ